MGLDHRFGDGPPLYFETMVFPKDDYSDMYCNRYTTRDEALQAHEKLVDDIKNGKYVLNGHYFELKDTETTESPSVAAAEGGV